MSIDVLIVGAGPTGLMLALAMKRLGRAVRVVERSPKPSEYSKALAVQSRTLELFDTMGIGREARSRGEWFRAVSFYARGRRVARLRLGGIPSRYPRPLILSQAETERILIEHLAKLGVDVERSKELTGFIEEDDGVTATVRAGSGEPELIQARWLVGCDGAHSAVRHALGLPFEGAAYPETVGLADVRIDWDRPPGEAEVYLSRTGVMGAVPMKGDRRYRMIDLNPHPQEANETSLAAFQSRFAEASCSPISLTDPVWISLFHLHRRIVPTMRVGRVFLAGDAAHIHSPAGGQGMNTGIQDALNLAWKLDHVLEGIAPESLLDSYTAERHPIAKAILRFSNNLFQTGASRSAAIGFFRTLILPRLLRIPAVQVRITRSISQIDLNYRSSPIVAEHQVSLAGIRILSNDPAAPTLRDWFAFRQGPRAGDRAPDARVATLPDRKPTRLAKHLSSERHTLLIFAGLGTVSTLQERLTTMARQIIADYGSKIEVIRIASHSNWRDADILDPSGAAHRCFGATSPILVLVRPDGHIAFRSQPPDREVLSTFLAGSYQ